MNSKNNGNINKRFFCSSWTMNEWMHFAKQYSDDEWYCDDADNNVGCWWNIKNIIHIIYRCGDECVCV